ncbi:PHP domain-containing protein [Gehongia tenuis]|uniref:PHP domain-containing protein n=1 Tax=Gehongia tenuis TaxID=2763655 RepID=A0A926D4Z7_9FIRM|nr:PHP domain-containing protein [Gehongia tenuis]MBC8531519.1 PHP domain-containing protein [Gehongia tenuis]
MELIGDFHTHTVYSHGKSTLAQNVARAKELGLRHIGVADHGPAHLMYARNRKSEPELRREVDELNDRYGGNPRVWMGVEANLIGLDGAIDIDEAMIPYYDLLLVGYHKGAASRTWRDIRGLNLPAAVASLTKWQRIKARMSERITAGLVAALDRYPVAIITHPGEYIPIDMAVVAVKAAEVGTALEINTKHPYVSVEAGRIAWQAGADLIVGSDAHTLERVGDLRDGVLRAEAMGVPAERLLNASDAGVARLKRAR